MGEQRGPVDDLGVVGDALGVEHVEVFAEEPADGEAAVLLAREVMAGTIVLTEWNEAVEQWIVRATAWAAVVLATSRATAASPSTMPSQMPRVWASMMQ